jgi:CheY-like chemotaxis protein
MLVAMVDDDEDFCTAVKRWTSALAEKQPAKNIELKVYKTGNDLFAFLRGMDRSLSGRTLILLDLDFDGKKTAGLDALLRIRQSNRKIIKKIPVVIYSNSDDPSEIDNSYLRFASSYVWKGNGFNEQKKKYLDLLGYWMEIAIVPPGLASEA